MGTRVVVLVVGVGRRGGGEGVWGGGAVLRGEGAGSACAYT